MENKKVQQRSIESRKKLHDAAYRLFSKKGYYNTNTKEIAKYAGISVGNFYNYYKDKEDIYCTLAEEYMKQSETELEKLENHLLHAKDVKEELRRYFTSQMERVDQGGRFFEDSQMIRKDSIRLQEIFAASDENVRKTLEAMLRKLDGIQKKASYPVMARIIYTMVNRVILDIMDTRGTEIYQEYLEEFISIIINYLFEEE